MPSFDALLVALVFVDCQLYHRLLHCFTLKDSQSVLWWDLSMSLPGG